MKKEKENENILVNLDGEQVYNKDTGEFYLEFTPEQENIIRKIMNMHDYYWNTLRAYAYPGVSAKRMAEIFTVLHDDVFLSQKPHDCNNFYKPTPLEVWKIVHTDFSDKQFVYAIRCLVCGVNVLDIKDIWTYPVEVFRLLYIGALYGKDFCSKVRKNMNMEKLEKTVMRRKQVRDWWSKLWRKIDYFLEPSRKRRRLYKVADVEPWFREVNARIDAGLKEAEEF